MLFDIPISILIAFLLLISADPGVLHPPLPLFESFLQAIDVLEKTLDDGFDTSFEPKEYIRIYTWVNLENSSDGSSLNSG